MQLALKTGSTASQLVINWSGTAAQLNCNVMLPDVANSPDIPKLADVNMAYSNSVSVEIITGHLNSVLRYAGVELNPAQLAETALSILASYWYLNLAELCIFFSQLKNGSRGQFVWGTKINNQAIMVALADFCQDRRQAMEKQESERVRQQVEKGFSRSEDLAKGIVVGTLGVRDRAEEAKQDYGAFCKFFPHLPAEYNPKVLWKAWGGDIGALHLIYGDEIPPADIAEKDIGSYLCDYNIAKSKENEGI